MQAGYLVIVQTFSEGPVLRIAVEIAGKTIYISSEEEWKRAIDEKREPECVGFTQRYMQKIG
jgi:hypothetical protein